MLLWYEGLLAQRDHLWIYRGRHDLTELHTRHGLDRASDRHILGRCFNLSLDLLRLRSDRDERYVPLSFG